MALQRREEERLAAPAQPVPPTVATDREFVITHVGEEQERGQDAPVVDVAASDETA